MVPFSFAGRCWQVIDSLALFAPAQSTLIVADLHLEKGSAFARHGQMLPPYDSRDTLARLERAIAASGARRVVCLGDSFHDSDGERRLEPDSARHLARLTSATDWHWVTGNHDEGLTGRWGGTVVAESACDGVVLRHAIDTRDVRPEVTGHYHPKLRMVLRGRHVSRPCFVVSRQRLVLPAFGAYAGGLDARDAALHSAFGNSGPEAACVVASGRMLHFPLQQR